MKNSVCPVNCQYCMASKIDARTQYWEHGERIGINKSCVFINCIPGDPPLKDMDIPWHLFDGEYLGFQGITDCFWDVYYEDFKYVVNKVKESKIKKLVLVSKIPVQQKHLELLKTLKDRVIVIYSITGMDALENTTTQSRLKSIQLLKDNDVDVLPIVHPYIHNYSDLSSFKTLEDMGITYVSWKGFRYNPDNMSELKAYIPADVLSQYINNEDEVLIGNDTIKAEADKHHLQYVDLKAYIQRPNSVAGVDKQAATKQVNELLNYVVVSSSEKDKEVLINYIINRRL